MKRAFTHPLFGSPPLPPLTATQARLAAVFNTGSRYLGDEDTLVRAPPPPAAGAAPPLMPRLLLALLT